MADVTVKDIVKNYGSTIALDSVSMNIADGELVALLGASGCGKTTMLRTIAGFEEIDSGLIRTDKKIFSSKDIHLPAEKRNVGVVFQSYALWPHMNICQNIGYPLKVSGKSKAFIDDKVKEALETVGLDGLGKRNPSELSGGQRQRVALARCLVMAPDVMLLDEPLANLDVHLRETMLQEFKEFHAKTKATMIFVTHDQSEAMAIADRIAVMDKGSIVQFSDPRTLYNCPQTTEVARFIGQGSVVPVTVRKVKNRQCKIEFCGSTANVRCAEGTATGQYLCALKGEWLTLDSKGFDCTVKRCIYKGGQTQLNLEICSAAPETENEGLRLNLKGYHKFATGTLIQAAITDGWLLPS